MRSKFQPSPGRKTVIVDPISLCSYMGRTVVGDLDRQISLRLEFGRSEIDGTGHKALFLAEITLQLIKAGCNPFSWEVQS